MRIDDMKLPIWTHRHCHGQGRSRQSKTTFFKNFLNYSFPAYVGILRFLPFSDTVFREISLFAFRNFYLRNNVFRTAHI
jgi:hypothetical protein